MEEQPDIMSFGRPRPDGPGRGIPRLAVFVAGLLVAGLAAGGYLAVAVTHRDNTINQLRTQLRQARQPVPGRPAAASSPALPVDSGSALSSFPDGTAGSFSLVTAAVRPRPSAAPLTWLFVYGRHASPGQRYGLLEGTCGGQFVTSSDMADGTADGKGDLTIVAPNLDISASSASTWILIYRLGDGVTLGGIKGPLIGHGAQAFRSTPPC